MLIPATISIHISFLPQHASFLQNSNYISILSMQEASSPNTNTNVIYFCISAHGGGDEPADNATEQTASQLPTTHKPTKRTHTTHHQQKQYTHARYKYTKPSK